jgi:hypothetical protein
LPVESDTTRVVHAVTVAAGRFAPGQLGELTQIVPFEMVDAALVATGRVQRRIRDLPSRVVVYLLLAAALFAECGYRQVWAHMIAGLDGLDVPTPSAGALAQARRRIGPAPLAALFDLLAGPAAGPATRGVWWRGRLVTALDGTALCCPDTDANLAVYRKGGSGNGGTGYPYIRLLALVACGTRGVLAATFGATTRGETGYTRDLISALHRKMIVLGDRNFAAADLIEEIAATGADLLIRVKAGRRLPVCRRCGDGSWISRIGEVEVRVIRCQITVATTEGRRSEVYQLITTVTDPDIPATELVRLYHDRWEIESTFLALKQTLGDGRVLRARTPVGLDQEVYALLVAYQALRIAIADATSARPTSTRTGAASPSPCTPPATRRSKPPVSSPRAPSTSSARSAARCWTTCCPTGAAAPAPEWSNGRSPNSPLTPPAADSTAPATRPRSASMSSTTTQALDNQPRRLTKRPWA